MSKFKIGSEEWKKLRRTKITASDAAIIMGVGFITPEILLFNKVNDVEIDDNAAMARGRRLEPEAVARFEKESGLFMYPEYAFHPTYDWMMATFDGISDCGTQIEVKSPGKTNHDLAKRGRIPKYYIPQLQHQLAVSEGAEVIYISYRPEDEDNPFVMIPVRRDDSYIEELITKELAFYKQLIATEKVV